MQIWVIYGILLVNECCGTLGTAVNEAYFALFSMGAHGTGMTPKDTRGKPNEHLFPRQVVIQLPKYVTHIIGEPKYKYGLQEQNNS